MREKFRYCPYCRSKVPLFKSGKAAAGGKTWKQRWECKKCHRTTIHPQLEK